MKRAWVVFSLHEAVCDYDREGIHWNDYGYTLYYDIAFNSKDAACKHIEERMKDYAERNIKNVRLTIQEVWFLETDSIFAKSL